MRALVVLFSGFCLSSAAACSSETPVAAPDAPLTEGVGGSGSSSSTTGYFASSSQSTGTAPPDVGQPSDVYPAPHADPPQVVSMGGPVLATPVFVPVVFASDDATMRSKLVDFSERVGTSEWFRQTSGEYGVSPASHLPAIEIAEAPPASLTDTQIRAWLTHQITTGAPGFASVDASSTASGGLYLLYYPKDVTITFDSPAGTWTSCQEFGAYHADVLVPGPHGYVPVSYAVMPRCDPSDGPSSLDAVTGAASHEIIEAVTDPEPFHAVAYSTTDPSSILWTLALGGGEVGDMCAQNLDSLTPFADLGYVAQRSWSNASAKAGHDPCVPRPAGEVYFNAAPVLPDVIHLAGGLTPKGVKIPVGQSRTIDLQLFSDGPTDDFQVSATELSLFGDGNGLLMWLDQDHGRNGQTLHLTIQVLEGNASKAEAFVITSSLGGRETNWYGMVGN